MMIAVGAVALMIVIAGVAAWTLVPRDQPDAAPSPTQTPTSAPSPAVTETAAPTPAPFVAWPASLLAADLPVAPRARWSADTDLVVTSTGRRGETLVTVGGGDSLTVALIDTESGEERWRTLLDERPLWFPLWAVSPSAEHIVVLTKDADTSDKQFRLVTLDHETGEVVSRSDDRASIVAVPAWGRASATVGGDVVVYTEGGTISRLASTQLTSPVWSVDAKSAVPHDSYFEVEQNIRAVGDVLLVGEAVHRLADGVDAGWKAPAGGTWVDADGALVHLTASATAAAATRIDPETGTSLWTLDAEQVVFGGNDLATLRAGGAYRVDPATGDVREVELIGELPESSGRILAATTDVVSVTTPDGQELSAYVDIGATDAIRIARRSDFSYEGGPLTDGFVVLSSPGYVYFWSYEPGVLYGIPRGGGQPQWSFPARFDDMDFTSNTAAGGVLFDRSNGTGVTALH
jgi:hypothetical protein